MLAVSGFSMICGNKYLCQQALKLGIDVSEQGGSGSRCTLLFPLTPVDLVPAGLVLHRKCPYRPSQRHVSKLIPGPAGLTTKTNHHSFFNICCLNV